MASRKARGTAATPTPQSSGKQPKKKTRKKTAPAPPAAAPPPAPEPDRSTGGRPPIEVTARDLEQIEVMARLGLREDAMACVLGWSERTFHRRKVDTPEVLASLQKGVANAAIIVGNKLWQAIQKGEGWAIRWYEMTRLKYRPGAEVMGPGGGPVPIEDVSGLSDPARKARIQELLDRGAQRALQASGDAGDDATP